MCRGFSEEAPKSARAVPFDWVKAREDFNSYFKEKAEPRNRNPFNISLSLLLTINEAEAINREYERRVRRRPNTFDYTKYLKEPYRTEARTEQLQRLRALDQKKKINSEKKAIHNRNPFDVSIRFFERRNKYKHIKCPKREKQSCHICLNAVNNLVRGPCCKAGFWLLSDSFFSEHRCGCFRRLGVPP